MRKRRKRRKRRVRRRGARWYRGELMKKFNKVIPAGGLHALVQLDL